MSNAGWVITLSLGFLILVSAAGLSYNFGFYRGTLHEIQELRGPVTAIITDWQDCYDRLDAMAKKKTDL